MQQEAQQKALENEQKALENERFLKQLQKLAAEIDKRIVIKNRIASLEDIPQTAAGYDKDIEV